MSQNVGLFIALLALAISATTAWLTLFRKGTVRMSQPTVIYFGPDKPSSKSRSPLPKVFLRTLLFATSKRGRVVESMYVSLSRNEAKQNFNIWVYGDDKLVRGSGLFVGEKGIAANHHFLTPKDGSNFCYIAGRYKLTVYAQLLGDRSEIVLFEKELEISDQVADKLNSSNAGLYFDWGQDSGRYIPFIDEHLPKNGLDDFVASLEIPTQYE